MNWRAFLAYGAVSALVALVLPLALAVRPDAAASAAGRGDVARVSAAAGAAADAVRELLRELPRCFRCRDRHEPRARDSLQLHLVLRPRDRHAAARRGRLGAARRAARRAPHRPLGAHALRSAGRHLGGPAQPVSPGRARSTGPSAAREAARRRCATAWARSRRGARGQRRKVARLLELHARRRSIASRASSPRRARCARRALRRLARVTRRDNILFDGFARVSHVTDATDWRVEYPFVVLTPGHRGRDAAAWCASCIELGLTIIPRGGGTGYTGGAVPLDAPLGGHQHRKARAPRRGRARSSSPGVARPAPTVRCGAGVVTKRVMEAAEDGGPGVRRRPDLGRRLVHRRQRRDERRRQEGGAVGHGARQPRVVAHGHAARRMARGRAPRAQPRQDPRRADRARFDSAYFGTDGKTLAARRDARDPGRALPQGRPRQGRHRQVPRRAARACRRKAATASSPRRASSCTACRAHIAHRVPGVLRPGARRGAGHRRDQATTSTRIRQARCWPGSSISTSAT